MPSEVQTLTALRGFAALWVVVFHYCDNVAWPNTPALVTQGALAVDIFFVLSGFILVYVYRDRLDIPDFLLKRFARLYPVHLVTLAGAVILLLGARLLHIEVGAQVTLREVLIHLFALHSLGFKDVAVLNYPSWSVSAEFTAYFIFPFIVSAVLRRDLKVVIPAVVAFFVFCLMLSDLTGRPMIMRTNDLSTLRILPEFVAGMLTARLCLENRIPRLIAACGALVLFVTGIGTGVPLVTVLSAPLLIAALYLYARPVPRPLRYLGLISYSLYMVHALVENLGFKVIEIALGQQIAPIWSLPVVTVAALGAAAVLYHLVEVPGRHFIVTRGRRRWGAKGQAG